MRKIKKTPKPQVLIDHAKEWTTEYCACLNAGNKPSDTVANRYNHPEIKTALGKETHEKCAYCESKIKHISYGDIEHILPKNRDARPDLYVEWANLTLSCEQCNRSGKRTYYNPKLSLATVYKGNIIKNLIMDCQSYTKYRPNETTGGIFVSWRRKEELPTGA